MAEFQEDIIVDDFDRFQQDPEPVLSKQHRSKLDSIVVDLYKQGATKEEIQLVVDDFKKKYATKPLVTPLNQKPPEKPQKKKPPAPGREMEGVFGKPPGRFVAQVTGAAQGAMPQETKNIIKRSQAIGKAKGAQEKILTELQSNDDVIKKMVIQQRFDAAGQQRGAPTSEKQVTGMIIPNIPGEDQQIEVTDEDVNLVKSDVETDETAARKVLNTIAKEKPEKKKDIQLSTYWLDAVRSAQGNDERLDKINRNAKAIEKGELIYDIPTGRLIRPQGVAGSLIEGWKQKSQLFDDFSFFNNKGDEEIIAELERRRTDYDPDEPMPVPKHKVAEMSQMAGSMPLKSLVAGGAVSMMGLPEAAPFVAGSVGGADFYRMGYAGSLQNVYYQMREEGKSEQEALKIAREQAQKEALIDAAVGGSMAALGARIGMKPINFSQGYRKIAIDFAKGASKDGAIQAAIGGTAEYSKNKLAQAAGINRDSDENVLNAIESNFLLTVGLGAAATLGRGLPKIKYRTLLNGLKKVPSETIEAHISNEINAGRITEEQATNIRNEINKYKDIDSKIPDNVTEDARLEIQKKLERKTELEGQLEKLDKAFHPEIKEKIKKLDEEINELSKQREPKEKESEQSKEAKLFIDDAVNEGVISGVYAAMAKENPEGFMKFVADQALGRTEDGAIHEAGGAEGQLREQFGDSLVDKALEMYPIEEKQSSISVIRPEEQKQTETITIKPKQDAVSEQITNEVDVRQQAGDGKTMGEGDTQPEGVAGKEAGKEGQVTGEEGVVPPPDPEKIGITHAEMDNLARELGLDEYRQDPETIEQWDTEARERFAKDPQAMNKVIQKLREGKGVDKVETRMMIMHMADLKARYNKNPTPELLDEIKRTKDLYNISGREKGKELVARKGMRPVEETLADFHMTDTEFNRAPLTDEQLKQSTKEFEEINAVKKAYEEKIAKLEAEVAAKKASQKIKEESQKAKKSDKKDYKAERSKIIDEIKEKLRKSRGEISSTAVPYAKELIAITPDVVKLIANVIEEGITKVPDIIKAVHKEVKQLLPQVTENDIQKIYLGEYTEGKTEAQLREQLFDLRKKAKLISELEALENGKQPKSEKDKIKRNRKIEDLKRQIQEADNQPIEDAEKLASIKQRSKREIAKIEEQLKKGDFSKPIRQEVQLDDEAKALRNKLNELREEREIRLMKMDYENTSKLKKAAREANQYLNISRQIKSTADVSMPFRQGLWGVASNLLRLPFKIESGKGIVFTNLEAQKQLVKAFRDMYASLAREGTYKSVMADIKNNRWYEVAKEAGLNLSDPNSPLEQAREEFAYPSKLEKIPVIKNIVKGSNRSASAFINIMKFNKFVEFAELFERNGMSIRNSPDAYKEAAIYANQTVGRGFLGQKVEGASWLTSRLFFSLRLQASRLQLLFKAFNPEFWTKTPREVRVEYMKDMIKTLALGATVIASAKAAGVDIEADPRSSEFGKVKVGNTVYDVWGGFQQYVVLFARMLSGATKSPETGKISELGNDRFGQKNRGDVLGRFFRTKTSPEVGTAWNIISGQRLDYKPVTVKGEIKDFFAPLVVSDVMDAYKDGGVQRAFITWLLISHGVGATTYGDDRKTSGGSDSKRPKREKPKKQTRTKNR
jgi:hypothetical protein